MRFLKKLVCKLLYHRFIYDFNVAPYDLVDKDNKAEIIEVFSDNDEKSKCGITYIWCPKPFDVPCARCGIMRSTFLEG